ncbi:hypothetical protein [uncultured Methylobacterium sp.]|jgi:hypothetical protein|nr:hypothetical protein [uncultured Methylobacterium sp.]
MRSLAAAFALIAALDALGLVAPASKRSSQPNPLNGPVRALPGATR